MINAQMNMLFDQRACKFELYKCGNLALYFKSQDNFIIEQAE